MFYILLLHTMIKWSINSSVTDTKLALGPILFTPNGIFCKKLSILLDLATNPVKLSQTLQLRMEPMPCRTVRLYFTFLRASDFRAA